MRLPCLLLAALTVSASAQSIPRKQLVEDLRLDGATEDFPAINRFAVGPHGQIAIWIHGDQTLRLYDSSGKKIASFGRKGGGPGESRIVNALGFKADTFWNYDNGLKRLTFVTPGGKLLRHELIPPNMNLGGTLDSSRGDALGAMYRFAPVMIAPNGQFVAYADLVVGREEDGRVKTEQSYLLSNLDGARRKRIGTYARSPIPLQVYTPVDETHQATVNIPFLSAQPMVYTTDGTRLGSFTHTLTDDGGSYHVFVVRTTGDTVFSRTYPFVGTRIPTAVRDSAIDAVVNRRNPNGTLTYEPKIAARLRDLAGPLTPRVYRPVMDMIIGRDNTTWLTMRAQGSTKEVVALNAKGDKIFSVMIPATAELKEASLTRLWVVEKDADDLPSMVRYRIK